MATAEAPTQVTEAAADEVVAEGAENMEVDTVKSAPERTAPSSVVQDSDWIVWDVNGDKQAFVQAKPSGTMKMGKVFVPSGPLIGVPFGSMFQLNPETETLELLSGKSLLEQTTKEKNTDKNNSELVDTGENQGMSWGEIEALKREAKDGNEIVEALCSKSKSFESKTVFSQEKYRKRKAKKYIQVATVRRPTAQTVASCFFSKMPAKVCDLRPDTLAVMLGMANAGPNQQVLVMETCTGLVVGAVAERLGGYGCCCSTYAGTRAPSIDTVRFFNFDPKTRGAVTVSSLASLEAAFSKEGQPEATKTADEAALQGEAADKMDNEVVAEKQEPETALNAGGEAGAEAAEEKPAAVVEASADAEPSDAAEGGAPQQGEAKANHTGKRPLGGYSDSRRMISQCAGNGGFTSCIIAAPAIEPAAALKRLMPLLAPSAAFVIFSNSLQALTNLMEELQQSREAVTLSLVESWHREYQVLPARTHPTMATSGTGGYLLSGVKVLNPPRPPVTGGDQKRQRR